MNLEYLKEANKKLGLSDDIQSIKNKNLIFVYCPPKVGSTSMVSSIRLSCSHCVTILHVHDEHMLEILCDIKNVTINEIIQYNRFLGKNVVVIDIYRTPIEHKISAFFENISYHFNNTEENINKYDINVLIRRFNKLFPHLMNTDYYRMVYNIPYIPRHFDFSNNYLMLENNGVKYIKVRLQDATSLWSSILKKTLDLSVYIVKDYTTDQKVISEMFKLFKQVYRIPENYLEQISQTDSLTFYLSPNERYNYLNDWSAKKTDTFECFTNTEYILYSSVSRENHNQLDGLRQNIQSKHYIDDGCCCGNCSAKRKQLLMVICNNNIVTLTEKDYIIHTHKTREPVPVPRRVNNNIIQSRVNKYLFSTKVPSINLNTGIMFK